MLSIDYAVMEKSKEIYTLPAEFGWSDLGSWGSLRTLLPQDEAGNAVVGKDIRLYECKNCVVHAADESKVVVQGLDGWLYCSREEWTTACLLFEREAENQGVWTIEIFTKNVLYAIITLG